MKTTRRLFFVLVTTVVLAPARAFALDIFQVLGLKKKKQAKSAPQPVSGQTTTSSGSAGGGYNGSRTSAGYNAMGSKGGYR